ncbi:MAG: hypothetical protein KKH67_01995, partial [candidate division Zixibacteria bacterium]|nr:hypothetical protein [candidate division Zixibacteria bacterium]MBU1469639.1 hypothetical protein [candidate division Zixibacteria bacterium]
TLGIKPCRYDGEEMTPASMPNRGQIRRIIALDNALSEMTILQGFSASPIVRMGVQSAKVNDPIMR